MDIQINADQGRGKTGLAIDLARALTGQRHANRFNSAAAFWVDPSLYYADKSPKAKITRAIVESRSDLVVLDDVLPQFLEYLKEAVQIARNSLRRNIVAIYCVQDAAVGVADSGPYIPLGFVRAEPLVWVHDEVIDPTPEQVEKLKNAFKDSANRGQFFVTEDEAPQVTCVKCGASIPKTAATFIMSAVARDSYVCKDGYGCNDYQIKESRTKEILLRLAREIHQGGTLADKEELDDVYALYGVDSVDALAPTFYADAHDRITPILDRVRCRRLTIELVNSGKSDAVKSVLKRHGFDRVSAIPLAKAGEIFLDLQLLDHANKRT